MPTEENGSIGSHYLPSVQAWNKYKNEGGQGEYKARAGGTKQDNLVQLTGLPSYWWRLSDLLPCMVAPTPQLAAVETPSAPTKVKSSEPMCHIEVSVNKLKAEVCMGDLQIQLESEETDEDCQGEECEECGGDGCTVSREPLSALCLIEHLLEDYAHCAASYAEVCGVDAKDVDILYRDLRILIGAIRYRI